MERLYLLAKIERGLSQADKGQLISHEEAEGKMKKFVCFSDPRAMPWAKILPPFQGIDSKEFNAN